MQNIILWRKAVTVLQGGTIGRIIEMPIDLLAQSAALFCPYRFRKFNGTSGYVWAMTVFFQQSHMPSQTRCPRTNNSFIHFVYGNHTDGAKRLKWYKDNALGRAVWPP